MTPDQIEEAAIEAGAMAAAILEVNEFGTVALSGEYHARTWDEVPPSTKAAILDKHRVLFRAAIKAYNAAMWRPASEHPANGITMLVSDGVDVWDLHGDRVGPKGVDQLPTHFRPLPKPPEKL